MVTEDTTGKSKIAKNVGASYVGHLVFVVFGFLMPRIIDSSVGQASLGVWDFSWSVVHFLNLSMIGLGSAVNRFVARYRAANDTRSLNSIISTVIALQVGIGLFVLGASIVLFLLIPSWFGGRLGPQSNEAAWVVGLLGSSLAVQMMFDAWRGVLTGCHRWDIHNAINAGGYAITAGVMIVTLLQGGDIKSIAIVYLVSTMIIEVIRWQIARRVCRELCPRLQLINAGDARKAVGFGLRNTFLVLPALVAVQTVSILVMANLGPAALAVLARPLSLVLQVVTLLNKYSFVLTPTAGSMQSQGNSRELHEFIVECARNGWLLAVPPFVFLFVLGDHVVITWMGEGYGDWSLTATLAVGYLLSASQSPMRQIMVGLNLHGRIAKINTIFSSLVLVAGIVVAEYVGWSVWVAVCIIAASVGFCSGVTILVIALRYLEISGSEYVQKILKDGLAMLAVLLVVLGAFRFLVIISPPLQITVGAALTAAVVIIMRRDDLMKIYAAMRKNKGVAKRDSRRVYE